MKVLIADDDSSVRELLKRIVVREGWSFCEAKNGLDTILAYRQERPDLILLDVMMPILDGVQACSEIRREDPEVPIIMLTAKGEIDDKGLAFESGCDDYIVTPLDQLELVMRVKAQLRKSDRRGSLTGGDALRAGAFEFDVARGSLVKGDRQIEMTSKEFRILYMLAIHQGEAVPSSQIVEAIWGDAYDGEITNLAVFVRSIRKKIEDDPSNPQHLQTVWRLGYRFMA